MAMQSLWVFLLIACLVVVTAVVLTLYLIVQHMRDNPHSVLRTCTIRILLLVPLYSIEAFAKLCTLSMHSAMLDELRFLRKFYEAVVVFSFLQLVLVSAGGPEQIVALFAPKPQSQPSSPVEEQGDFDEEASWTRDVSWTSAIMGPEEHQEEEEISVLDPVPESPSSSSVFTFFSPASRRRNVSSSWYGWEACPQSAGSGAGAGAGAGGEAQDQAVHVRVADGGMGPLFLAEDSRLTANTRSISRPLYRTPEARPAPLSFDEAEAGGEAMTPFDTHRRHTPERPRRLHPLSGSSARVRRNRAMTPPWIRLRMRPLRPLRRSRLLGWLMPVWPSASNMLRWCVFGPLLYVLVAVVCALLGALVDALELCMPETFREGGRHKAASALALQAGTVLLFLASLAANLSLHELTKNVKQEIACLRLTGKLLSIKLIVFVTFWQSLVLQLISSNGSWSRMYKQLGFLSQSQFDAALESGLLCFEMLATALIHIRIWRTEDFQAVFDRLGTENTTEEITRRPSRMQTFRTVMDLGFIAETVNRIESIHCCSCDSDGTSEDADDLDTDDGTGSSLTVGADDTLDAESSGSGSNDSGSPEKDDIDKLPSAGSCC